MNKYRIGFWYYTDLRTEETVTAPNEVAAIAIAYAQATIIDWCQSEGFRVTICRI